MTEMRVRTEAYIEDGGEERDIPWVTFRERRGHSDSELSVASQQKDLDKERMTQQLEAQAEAERMVRRVLAQTAASAGNESKRSKQAPSNQAKLEATGGRRSRRNGRGPKNPRIEAGVNILLLLLGSFIVAVSFNIFYVPLGIASGGVSGISILVNRLTDIPPAYTQWALNVPLFFLGLWLLGRRFALKTALGSFVLPLFVLMTSHWSPPTENAMLASIYGGIGVGAGLGLVFRGRGSTGGLDLAAQLLHKFTGIRLGLSVACLDGLVIIAAGFIIAPENSLYALVGLFVTSKTIDFVQTGLTLSKVAFIVSDHPDEITQVVLHDLDRGLTKLGARGGYTNEERTVLMIVVGQGEVSKLKQLVKAADPDAFVIISDTAEVLGQGFSLP